MTASRGCDCAPARPAAEAGCGCADVASPRTPGKMLEVELLAIDLETCKRCVPTGARLEEAVRLLAPAAEALGVELRRRETVVRTAEEAKARALLTSPTIRLNGRDLAQDVRESCCESCGDLTADATPVDCREWHYRGEVFSAAPLPLLVEAIMAALLDLAPPVEPAPLAELPQNLRRYFEHAKAPARCC